MPTDTKVLANQVVGCKKALSMTKRFESSREPLALARWLVRILGTVVQLAVLAIFHTRQYLAFGQYIGQALKVLHDPWDPSYVKVWREEGGAKTYICTAHPQRILAGEGISQSLTEHNKDKLRKLQEKTRASAKRLATINKQQQVQRVTTASPQVRAPQSPQAPSPQGVSVQKELEERIRRLQYQRRHSD